MMGSTVMLAALLASASAGASEWAPITVDGAWSLRASTVTTAGSSNGMLVSAVVRRTYVQDGQPAANVYMVQVKAADCAARSGVVTLAALDGRPIEQSRFRFGENVTAAVLASAVCTAATGVRR